MSEMEVLGSKETSSKPGPAYRSAPRIVDSPPQATSLSKNCERKSTLSTVSSPPRQYTAENEADHGVAGATSAIVRRIAVAVNRSLEGSFSRLTPLVRAPRTTDVAATPGALLKR